MKFNGQWIPDASDFRAECLTIAKDLTGFKKNPIYCRFINNDNRNYNTALAFYTYIVKHYPHLLEHFGKFKENDIIGNPTTYAIGPDAISPGTLRFIKVLGDIGKFEAESIVEIGSGYGGQCKVIQSLRPVDYTLIDIPESLAVANKYLGNFFNLYVRLVKSYGYQSGYKVVDKVNGSLERQIRFISCEDDIPPRKYDLVISDYCLSEMDKSGVDFYIQSVVQYCRNGYFTCNEIGVTDYLIEQLQIIFHQVEIKPERPKTSKHKNIIVYAMGNRHLQ